MKTKEIHRQFVHLSGLLFVVLAQFTGGALISLYFFIIAFTLFVYSQYIISEQKRLVRMFSNIESKFRDLVTSLERKDVPRPFTGAIWFFFSLGLVFLVFPLPVASAAGMMLAVGDGLSTLIGINFGKRKLLPGKTLEGSLACFFGSLTSLVFIAFPLALLGSVVATLMELLPGAGFLKKPRKKGLIDDNFLIPVVSGLVIYAAGLFI